MKSQREPSAGKEVMKGHGKMCNVRIFSGWDMFSYLIELHGIFLNFYREVLKEDESGSLKATVEEILYESKRKRCVRPQFQYYWKSSFIIETVIIK